MSVVAHGGERRALGLGKTIFDYADELAVEVPTSCHRTGHCHECIVEVRQGIAALSPRNETESFLRGNFRLACQAVIERDDADIEFAPLRRRPRILSLSHVEKRLVHDPAVIRRGEEVCCEGEVIDRYRGHLYGLAVDLGTTTVVMDLVDLETGVSVHTSSFENPQRFGGSDVMNRISFDGGDNHGELQRAAVAAINREIVTLARKLGFARTEIYEIVVAANTTMREILFKRDVQSVGQKPYKSVIEHEYLAGQRSHTALVEKARRLGLRASPAARVYGLPLIACHVGADTAADLVALDMAAGGEDTVMLVDMGTNTEVVICHGGRIVAASCPAGPAFEGGLIKYGMSAYEGAIESVRIEPGAPGITYKTIGGVAPVGFCGSGLIDVLADLRRHGRMTEKGVFVEDRKLFELMLVPEYGITFSREDASNLGQAKAANYCGQIILMRALGIDPGDVARFYLAGGFANYVDVENAVAVGLLAPVPAERVVKVGNAAIQGAREILLSLTKRRELEQRVKAIEHIELETTPDFFELFVDGCQFKPMPAATGPRSGRAA